MAGRKQHFIQQHLIRGFSYDHPRNPCHVWVYRQARAPFSTATEGYGAERDFYGKPGVFSLDEQITEIEANRYNALITTLRTRPPNQVDSASAADLAIHVMVRSKNLRSMLADGIEAVMAHAGLLITQPAFQEKLAATGIRRDPRFLAGLGITPREAMRPAIARKVAKLALKEARRFVRNERPNINAFMEGLLSNLREFVAEAQRRTLRKHLHDFTGTRATQLRSLHWLTMDATQPLILGDSVVFMELADGKFKPATEPGDALRCVWFPVSSRRILLGTSAPILSELDVDRINRGAAACSYDAFCAADGPSMHADHVPFIRSSTFCLDDENARKVAIDGIRKALQ